MKSLADIKPYRNMFVDGMNLCARSYYGMPDLSHNGHRTGMLYGVVRLVMDWRERYRGLNITFVWEGDNSWRKSAYPEYKANRTRNEAVEPDEDFPYCVRQVQESLSCMGVVQVDAETYEADDTVYTVSKDVEGRVLFVSNDWDWWPLVSRGDVLYHDQAGKSNIVLDHDAMKYRFANKFKCEPIDMSRLWLFKVLTGDSSDGVSGVPLFRKKIAANLANDPHVTLDNIPEQLRTRGLDRWADVVEANMPLVRRNFDVLLPRPPAVEDLYIVPEDFHEELFENVLLKSGMADMFERFHKSRG